MFKVTKNFIFILVYTQHSNDEIHKIENKSNFTTLNSRIYKKNYIKLHNYLKIFCDIDFYLIQI